MIVKIVRATVTSASLMPIQDLVIKKAIAVSALPPQQGPII